MFVRNGWGIYQMPCPEQRAWGGVLKRHLLRAYGSKPGLLCRLRRPLLRLFISWRTRDRPGVWHATSPTIDAPTFGWSGSWEWGHPRSCGVTTTFGMRRSFEVVAPCPLAAMNRETIKQVQ
jgi:hypothetical protein